MLAGALTVVIMSGCDHECRYGSGISVQRIESSRVVYWKLKVTPCRTMNQEIEPD